MEDVLTQGNVKVNEIEIGDVHYEYDMGLEIKSTVLTKPVKNEDGNWEWTSQQANSDRVIDYLVNPEYTHYSVKLYDNQAYKNVRRVRVNEPVVDELSRYNAVNGTKNLEDLAVVIESFSDNEGMIHGIDRKSVV